MTKSNFNREAVDRFEQAHGAKIKKLFWIAGSLDDNDFLDFLYDEEDVIKDALPEIFNSESFPNYIESGREGIQEALVDHRKFGFLAEIHIPDHRNFSFNKGKKTIDNVSGCSVHEGVNTMCYVYAESQLSLMDEIEKAAAREYNEQFKRWLREQHRETKSKGKTKRLAAKRRRITGKK